MKGDLFKRCFHLFFLFFNQGYSRPNLFSIVIVQEELCSVLTTRSWPASRNASVSRAQPSRWVPQEARGWGRETRGWGGVANNTWYDELRDDTVETREETPLTVLPVLTWAALSATGRRYAPVSHPAQRCHVRLPLFVFFFTFSPAEEEESKERMPKDALELL